MKINSKPFQLAVSMQSDCFTSSSPVICDLKNVNWFPSIVFCASIALICCCNWDISCLRPKFSSWSRFNVSLFPTRFRFVFSEEPSPSWKGGLCETGSICCCTKLENEFCMNNDTLHYDVTMCHQSIGIAHKKMDFISLITQFHIIDLLGIFLGKYQFFIHVYWNIAILDSFL